MTLRLKRWCFLMCLSIDSKNATVHRPPNVSKDMSTRMLSTRHFKSLTCTLQKINLYQIKDQSLSILPVLPFKVISFHVKCKQPTPLH